MGIWIQNPSEFLFYDCHLQFYSIFSLQTLMWLQFLNDFCPNTKYVLKIDSDITFNYFKLVKILQNRTKSATNYSFLSKSFSCFIKYHAEVERNETKWLVQTGAKITVVSSYVSPTDRRKCQRIPTCFQMVLLEYI